MENQTPTAPEPIVAQFGYGQKIHYITFRIATPLGRYQNGKTTNKSFVAPMSCGVENRWNVHGTFERDDLTIADVDCKKCRAHIEHLREIGRLDQ